MREIETDGIINLTLKKISGTLFKVVKDEIQVKSQPETSKDKGLAVSPNLRLSQYRSSQIKVVPLRIHTQEEEMENNIK